MAKSFEVYKETDEQDEKVSLSLVDNGDGTVDVTDSDGLYLVQFAAGKISLYSGLDNSGYEVDKNGFLKVTRD